MTLYTVEVKEGMEIWYQKGKIHRENGPAITKPDGTQKWYQKGKGHREDGPALIKPDGTQQWYQNDELHREDGPAAIYGNGLVYYYIKGVQLSEMQFNNRIGGVLEWNIVDGKVEWTLDGEAYSAEKAHKKIEFLSTFGKDST